MFFPLWAGLEVLLESDVSEEEPGVTVQRGDDVGSRDDLTNLVNFVAQSFWSFGTPHVPERVSLRDAAASELVQVRALPSVGEAAGVVWSEFASERPDGVVDVVSELVVV